jgi:hypothetical protein
MRRLLTCLVLGAVALLLASLTPAESVAGRQQNHASQARWAQSYGKLPLHFEPNRGQTDKGVKFLARGPGYTLFLTGDEVVLSLRKPRPLRDQPSAARKPKTANRNWTVHGLESGLFHLPALFASPGLRVPSAEPPRATRESRTPSVVKLRVVGSNADAKVSGLDELPGKSNYFIGNNPKKWRTNVPNYAKVQYQNVYPGIDVVYYGTNQRQLEYDFVVAPGADPRAIRVAIETGNLRLEIRNSKQEIRNSKMEKRNSRLGSSDPIGESRDASPEPIRIDATGDLVITTANGEARFHKPIVYQPSAVSGQWPVGTKSESQALNPGPQPSQSSIANRQWVEGRFVLHAARGERDNAKPDASSSPHHPQSPAPNPQYLVSFELGPYDKTRPLVIDPVLTYATYLGGSDQDYGADIAVDASGNVYLTGATLSTDFPPANALDSTRGSGNGHDAFVVKMDPTASSLVYSTYLGGSMSAGSQLATGDDQGNAIAVDGDGDAYLTGSTQSVDFPTTEGAFQTGLKPQDSSGTSTRYSTDVFVSKLNSSGSSLLYSTYLGGSGLDVGYDIALDDSGHAFVTGKAGSPPRSCIAPCTDYLYAYPTTVGAYVTTLTGGSVPFVTKLFADGSWVVYSTLLSALGHQEGHGVAVDTQGVAYVTGMTEDGSYPATDGAYDTTYHGGNDAFVAAVNASGSDVVYSTFLGGSSDESGDGIALDSAGNAYILGYTSSNDFPTTDGAFDTSCGSDGTCDFDGTYLYWDIFVSKLNAAGNGLDYSTYLGGSNSDISGNGITVDGSGNATFTGYTYSHDFPVANPVQASSGGGTCGTDPDTYPCIDAVISTLNDTGSDLLFSTYLGGSDNDGGNNLAQDWAGNIYVTGQTWSTDFPATSGAYQNTFQGVSDAFVLKISQAPPLTLQPASLTFGLQGVGSTSSAETVTVTNHSGVTVNLSGIAVSGDFAETHTCGSSLADGADCTIDVTFTPSATGPRKSVMRITSNLPDSPHRVMVTGLGTAIGLSPSSLYFPSQPAGTSSDPQTITLTNHGAAAVHVWTTAIAGANSSEFTHINNCPVPPATLAKEGSCTVSVRFSPASAGAKAAALLVSHDGGGSPGSVGVSGTGAAPLVPTRSSLSSLSILDSQPSASPERSGAGLSGNSQMSPDQVTILLSAASPTNGEPAGSVSFGSLPVGRRSAPSTVMVRNAGPAPLRVTGIAIAGPAGEDFQLTTNCPASLRSEGACSIELVFTPHSSGPRRAQLTVDYGASDQRHVNLDGMGQQQ